MANERYGTPVVLKRAVSESAIPLLSAGEERLEESVATVLSEIPLNNPPFREDRLQELIARYPTVLPVQEIEPAFTPLICLGREIPCKSGTIDILFTSPTGQLTLVETKLWDNPESLRTVIGQIIDYAKDMSKWSFNDLDRAIKGAGIPVGKKGEGILDITKRSTPDLADISYQDTVARNLQYGKFLIVIAGNGIRENVLEMAEYLQSTPSLHFSLALVELALFRFDSKEPWALLIQPRIVGRILPLVRAVVEVRAPQGFEVNVTLPPPEPETLTETDFFEKLQKKKGVTITEGVKTLVGDLVQLGLIKQWGKNSVSLRIPDPRGLADFTVVVINHAGRFYLGWLYRLAECGYDSEIANRYLNGVMRLTGAKPSGTPPVGTKETPVEKLVAAKDGFMALVTQFLDELRAAADKRQD